MVSLRPYEGNRDHSGHEMLVSVFAAIPSYDASWFPSLTSKVSAMMALDPPVVPAVVLVVEDEMLLRMRAVDMVEDAGYTSVEAVDADEAVAILGSRSDVAMMFTDIQMPGSMDGLKLSHTRPQSWRPIKIILVSGQV